MIAIACDCKGASSMKKCTLIASMLVCVISCFVVLGMIILEIYSTPPPVDFSGIDHAENTPFSDSIFVQGYDFFIVYAWQQNELIKRFSLYNVINEYASLSKDGTIAALFVEKEEECYNILIMDLLNTKTLWESQELEWQSSKFFTLSPNGTQLLICKRGANPVFYDFAPSLARKSVISLKDYLLSDLTYCGFQYSSNGKYVAICCEENVLVYNTMTKQLVNHVRLIGEDMDGVVFSEDCSFLAVNCIDKIIVVDLTKREIFRSIPVRAHFFSIDGSCSRLAVYDGKAVSIFDLNTRSKRTIYHQSGMRLGIYRFDDPTGVFLRRDGSQCLIITGASAIFYDINRHKFLREQLLCPPDLIRWAGGKLIDPEGN